MYLNELDQFVKQQLKAKYYLRYVDDFLIVHPSGKVLEDYKCRIDQFLREKLALQLHPDKSRIIFLSCGVEFLGFKIFLHHKRIKKKNKLHFYRKYEKMYTLYRCNTVDYDKVYDFMEGWIAYAKNANTFNVRKIILSGFEERYPLEISSKEVNRYLKEDRKIINQIITKMKNKK